MKKKGANYKKGWLPLASLTKHTGARRNWMSTLIENKRTWRAVALILLLIAMIGPWFYERVYVPLPKLCTTPNV